MNRDCFTTVSCSGYNYKGVLSLSANTEMSAEAISRQAWVCLHVASTPRKERLDVFPASRPDSKVQAHLVKLTFRNYLPN